MNQSETKEIAVYIPTLVNFLDFELGLRDMTYYSLAKELGIAHATLNRWITGEDKPEVKSCLKLAKWFNLPVSVVIEMAGYRL